MPYGEEKIWFREGTSKLSNIHVMCKALVHDNSTLKYVTKLACRNPMSVSGRNWHDCINVAEDISMISMNVKQV